jgi:hypothetical protein
VLVREFVVDAFNWLIPFLNTENNYPASLVKDSQEFVVGRVLKVHNRRLKDHSLSHELA